jgi:endonuclease YncB( thermonuclease family)
MTEYFSFEGVERTVSDIRVIDGDTFEANMRVPSPIDGAWTEKRFCFRLLGIDTPEMHPPKIDPDREVQMMEAQKSKHALLDLVTGQDIRVSLGKFDHFGRVMCTLYSGQKNCNECLVARGLAITYHGKNKVPWKEMYEEMLRARQFYSQQEST